MSNPGMALSYKRGPRKPKSLAASNAITITVNQIQTYLYNFAMTPTSGNAPFTITFTGYLSDYSGAVGDISLLNGETIQIQQLINGTWTNIGVTAVTAENGTTPGYFSGSVAITLASYPPGSYQFRAYYGGNTTKGLSFSIGNLVNAGVGTAAKPSAVPGIVLAAAILVGVGAMVAA